VLACIADMAGSGIGFWYVVSLSDGVLRFSTEQGPISEVAALGEGAFLVGYQCYDSFETLRYERDGRIRTRWSSHRYYVIRGEDIRVIELENRTESKSHLVRLLPDGLVEKGDWLDGYYTSPPFLRTDGTMFFIRRGAVLAARDITIDEHLEFSSSENSFYSNTVVGDDQGIYFAYDQHCNKVGGARLIRIDF
jgi:hypothetical protein